MVTSQPTFTVIVAVRNGASTLQRALDSVIEQTYRGIEIVVMDGASTDGTQAVLERNAEHIAYWESKPDRGVYNAWNKALDHATGEWIDLPGLRRRVPRRRGVRPDRDRPGRRRRAPSRRLRVSRQDPAGRNGRALHDRSMDRRPATAVPAGGDDPHPATFHHRSLFERHGRFDETFRIAGDFEFLLRELLTDDALFIPELIVDMTGGGLSDLPKYEYLVQREVYRARYMHGIVTAPPWRSAALYRRLGQIWLKHTFGRETAKTAKRWYRSVARRFHRRR